MKMLSLGALMAVMLTAGAAAGQDACGTAFNKLDMNKDRALSFEEFCQTELLNLENLKKLPFADEIISKPGTGGTAPGKDELSRRLFEKADKNKDKKIDRMEWEEFYSTLGF